MNSEINQQKARYTPPSVFGFAYFLLLIASIYKLSTGLSNTPLSAFSEIFPGINENIVNIFLVFFTICYSAYMFSTYITLERDDGKDLVIRAPKSKNLLKISTIAKILLVILI